MRRGHRRRYRGKPKPTEIQRRAANLSFTADIASKTATATVTPDQDQWVEYLEILSGPDPDNAEWRGELWYDHNVGNSQQEVWIAEEYDWATGHPTGNPEDYFCIAYITAYKYIADSGD